MNLLTPMPIERCFDLARGVEVHLVGNIHYGESAVAAGGPPLAWSAWDHASCGARSTSAYGINSPAKSRPSRLPVPFPRRDRNEGHLRACCAAADAWARRGDRVPGPLYEGGASRAQSCNQGNRGVLETAEVPAMKIAIPGGSGQVGHILARHFHAQGHAVTVFSRKPRPNPWREILWDGLTPSDWTAALE